MFAFFRGKLAEWTGLEPATPGVTGRYSNQLNYHSNKTYDARARGFRRSGELPDHAAIAAAYIATYKQRRYAHLHLVGADGIEPPTFAL